MPDGGTTFSKHQFTQPAIAGHPLLDAATRTGPAAKRRSGCRGTPNCGVPWPNPSWSRYYSNHLRRVCTLDTCTVDGRHDIVVGLAGAHG